MSKRNLFFLIILALLCQPVLVGAQDLLRQKTTFNIESSFDFQGRKEIAATLVKTTRTAYWFLDNAVTETEEIKSALDSLSQEFEEKIYPILTGVFGSEWNPGIDKDTRITILIHPMEEKRGGYFDTADEYPKVQIPESNEKEMVYLNSQYLIANNAKSFLAHEFLHLITFNQKDKNHDVPEDVWLNEARAEYASTLLGYDSEYEGSNLQQRVKDFLNRPSNSLTEWKDLPEDYGVANLFIQYLVDHYGIGILADSLKMRKTGIESINAVLAEGGFKEDFSQIFINWAIAVLTNDCSLSEKYCYFNDHLQDFRITPLINYLPLSGESTLSVINSTKDWSGNWHKFIGGGGTALEIEFRGTTGIAFEVPYVISKTDGTLSVGSLELNRNGEGELRVADFGTQNIALVIIPIAQNKISNFSNLEPHRSFFWSASTQEKKEISLPVLSPLTKPISQMTGAEILDRIAEIRSVVLALQRLLSELESGEISCSQIAQDLYFGMIDSSQVRCLQEFLKSQGPDIYSEGLVTGSFYALTEKAVIRFQEKYAAEILTPLGLAKGTGYVGPATRAKINKLLTE